MKSIANLLTIVLLMSGCATTTTSDRLTPKAYEQAKGEKTVVLLAVNWGRRWGCGDYANAQLRRIGFDRIPVQKQGDGPKADLILEGGPSIVSRPMFIGYAFLVEPGEYALTDVSIKVARSQTDIFYLQLGRTKLIQADRPMAGSFEGRAGEIVYVGDFGINCTPNPTIWRYKPKGDDKFKTLLSNVKKQYPFLNVEHIQFRMFQTQFIGDN